MPKVIAKLFVVMANVSVGMIWLWVAFFGKDSLPCLAPFLLALVILTAKFVWRHCYRPQENHLGVIYRFGRFHRFVDPEEWTVLIPFWERVHREVSLYMRTVEATFKKVELRDGLAIDMRLKVFFRTDLRLTTRENLLQVLKFEGPEWPEMIKTSLEDIVRNQVFLESTYEEIVSQRKSREIKKRISREISMRMRGFGIVINEEFGAMPVDIQPHQTYFEAVQTSRAAAPLGEAALERLRPVLNELNRIKHEDARTAFLLELASKIAEVKDLPEIVMPSMDGNATGEGRDAKRILRGGKAIYPEPGRSQQGKYPLAE
ncbi:MAG TPA: SPFH domain-containing protein [Anaerolineales bacterium]|nr:SPFH domain-containing protein [Anaerolineales bacterium]